MANRYFSDPSLRLVKPDLAGPLVAGLRLAEQRAQRLENQRQFEEGQKAAAAAAQARAQKDAFEYDLKVANLNLKMEDRAQKDAEFRRLQQRSENKKFLAQTRSLTNVAKAYAAAPEGKKEMLRDYFLDLYAQGINTGILPPGQEQSPEEWLERVNNRLALDMSITRDSDFDEDAAASLAADKLNQRGIPVSADPATIRITYPEVMEEARREIEAAKASRAPKTTVNIDNRMPGEGDPLTAGTRSWLQRKVSTGIDTLVGLKNTMTDPEKFMGLVPQIKGLMGRAFDLIGKENIEALGFEKAGEYINFAAERIPELQEYNRLRSLIIHENIGGQQAKHELERMDKWLLDPDLSGPEVFTKARDRLMEIIARETKQRQRQLEGGIPLDLDEFLPKSSTQSTSSPRPQRTDPTTGETRFWDGEKWVAE